jgi:hypothetical protein
MAKSNQKNNISKKFKFDLNRWEYIENDSYVESNKNPIAIAYVRVSDQKQVDEWNGLASQEATSRRWANRENSIKIENIFKDSAKSGRNLDRKWLLDAIAYLEEKNRYWLKIKYFLCTEISRISRSEDITQTLDIIKKIENTWVEIITTADWRNISSKNTNDSFMTDFNMIRAKYESLQIWERSMNGSKSKLYAWYWVFHPPVWYERIYVKSWRKTEKLMWLIEPQASIVKEWLELFWSFYSCFKIS